MLITLNKGGNGKMNTFIISLPILSLFIYGFFNIGTENNKRAKKGMLIINNGSLLAKGWILAITILTLIISITGI